MIEIGTWVRRSNETRFLTLAHLVESVIADEPITRCGRRLGHIEGTTIRPHGLDMRLHPRCYLCTPVPETRVFTLPAPVPACTCPTVWYGTMRPPGSVHNPVITWSYNITNTVRAKP